MLSEVEITYYFRKQQWQMYRGTLHPGLFNISVLVNVIVIMFQFSAKVLI